MSETMRQQIEAEARAARGKLPPVAGVACARPAGFPTAAALPSDITEAREAHAEGGIPEGGNSPAPDVQPHESGFFPADQPKPEAYTSPQVQSACRSLSAAIAGYHAKGLHYLALSDAEFLHLHSALSQERTRTRNAVGKGRCKIGDLRCTDSVWEKLQGVYFGRILYRRRPA